MADLLMFWGRIIIVLSLQAAMAGSRPRVTILVTLLEDSRVIAALQSLIPQEGAPFELVVADGGSSASLLRKLESVLNSSPAPTRLEVLPGSVARTRNLALPLLKGEVVVFLDADEIAPAGWLQKLTGPILSGEVDFTGGPTRPLGEPSSVYERYLNAFDEWLYRENVARDITFLPMGNSAWRTEVLRSVGGFDERLSTGGEDYDITLRAVAAGYRGAFVPEAWVFHDQSHLNSFRKYARRRYRYTVGAVMAYRKNRVLKSKALAAARPAFGLRHPLDLLDLSIKPLALIHGILAWSRWGG